MVTPRECARHKARWRLPRHGQVSARHGYSGAVQAGLVLLLARQHHKTVVLRTWAAAWRADGIFRDEGARSSRRRIAIADRQEEEEPGARRRGARFAGAATRGAAAGQAQAQEGPAQRATLVGLERFSAILFSTLTFKRQNMFKHGNYSGMWQESWIDSVRLK